MLCAQWPDTIIQICVVYMYRCCNEFACVLCGKWQTSICYEAAWGTNKKQNNGYQVPSTEYYTTSCAVRVLVRYCILAYMCNTLHNMKKKSAGDIKTAKNKLPCSHEDQRLRSRLPLFTKIAKKIKIAFRWANSWKDWSAHFPKAISMTAPNSFSNCQKRLRSSQPNTPKFPEIILLAQMKWKAQHFGMRIHTLRAVRTEVGTNGIPINVAVSLGTSPSS